eukprot:g12120.t1
MAAFRTIEVQSGQHKAALSKNSVVDLVQMAHINTHTGRKRPLRWLGEEALMEQVELPNAIGGKVAVPSRYQVFVEGSGWKTMSVKGSGSLRHVGDEVERESRTPDEVASFDAGEGGLVRWTGLVTLDPGSRVRLTGPSDFRLTWGRARRALVGAVLADASVRPGQCEGPVPRPVLSILVVMPAVPPEAGVGCMTPNWTLVAALEEAMYRALGARYQLFVVPISQEEQLGRLDPAAVKSLLDRAEVQGAVYLLSPQRVAGEFRTKHDLVHDVPLFQLMERLEEAQGRTPPEQVHAAVKVGYSWRSAGVTLCHGLVELANTLLEVARGGEHSSFMVQELIDGILCEAMVYVLHGQMVAHPQYYRFPEHKAPPQYLHRKAAKEILGGETALAHCEEVMKKIVEHWILWASAQCATPIPFLRIDFLLSVAAPGSAPLAVWTGEVSELGVAVELQGLHGHESRELVMDTLMASVLRGHGHPPSKVGDAGGTHSWQGGGTHVFEEHGCKYRVNLEERTLTNLTTGQTASIMLLSWLCECPQPQTQLSYMKRRRENGGCDFAGMAGIVVCVSGLPGAMGHEVSQACIRRGMTLAPVGLTGPSMPAQCQVQEGALTLDVKLVGPEAPGAQKQALEDGADEELKKQHGDRLVIIDFTHPTAVNPNSELGVYAVIAPNMGKQIVALQAAMERMGRDFPGAFGGYKLEVTESHQKTKADTSGTAKAMVGSFQQLGVEPFSHDQIQMLRDDASQAAFGVPPERGFSTGHAWHTYTLTSPDGSVQFQFKHNVCGRRTYGEGVADAVEFIARKALEKSEKKIFNMIDILEAGEMK